MAYESVKNQIDAYIKANGVNLITGPVLNAVLTTMLDELGEGYAFQGVLDTTDTPSPAADIPQAWLASAGTYLGGSITVDEGELALIIHTSDGWSKETVYRGVQLSYEAIVAALGYTPADDADLAEKQDTIADLSDIRSGAALGETSVQPVDIENMVEAEPIGSIVPPVNPSEFATKEELSQLGQKVQELFLQELTGAAYATWNTSAGQTHYVIPVNGGEDVSFDNTAGTIYCAFLKSYSTPVSGATPDFCTGYSGRQSYAESAGFTIPTDCRFLIINNPNGNYSLSSLKIKGIEIANGVHGSISNIGDKLKQIWAGFAAFEDGHGRYITPFYPCFVARASSHDDVNMSVSSAGGTISAKNSTILKSFSELTLLGFDKTKPHFVSLFRNGFNGGTEYQIEFSKIDGNTITQVVRFYIPVAQITNAGGINHIDVTDGNYKIQAVIDFSSFPSGGAVTCRTIEYANFVVARHCFESVEEELEEVYNYVDESLADTVKDSDLHLATGVNLANPDNIDDGHYVSNSGTIQENADWSMVSIPVTAGVKYTFGGFYLGRNGYYCFYNGTEIVGSAVLFSDPNGTQYPVTVTAPVGANKIIIDIKTGNSPTGAYSNLMVNVGETLAQYEPYKVEIDKIKGYQIMGSESGGGDINGLLANLPVSSDGSTIPSGYAYIEQSTGAIKVKMS